MAFETVQLSPGPEMALCEGISAWRRVKDTLMIGGILGWFINKWKTGIGIHLICIVTHMLAKAFSPWDREEIILNSVPQIGRSKDLLR